MSEQQNFGFGKFVPGFDFLQNLSKGTPQQPAAASLSSWVAPTLNVEELDKRISELKAVSFWLDQNAKALAATIQALELQKMTLATLRGMNFNMGEIASALKLPAESPPAATRKGGNQPPEGSVTGAANEALAKSRASRKNGAPASDKGAAGNTAAAGVVDPLQWWGALTTQFQEIAAGALREAGKNPPAAAPKGSASSESVAAGKKKTAGKTSPKNTAARKTASRSS